MTNKEASEKFGVPKNTINTWMKNKDKLFEGLEQSSYHAKKLWGCDYEQVDKAIFKWVFFSKKPKRANWWPNIQRKGASIWKKFNFPTFKASDGCVDSGKKGKKTTFTVK